MFNLEYVEHTEEEQVILNEEKELKMADIVTKVTFENANDFVYSLVHHDREAAAAVFKEFQYWDDALGRL